jgi:glutamyl-tRNA reductase
MSSAHTIAVISFSHKNAPVEFRDRISVDKEMASRFIDAAMGTDSSIREIAILSTCNRTEFYFVSPLSFSDLRQWLVEQYLSLMNTEIIQPDIQPSMLQNEEAVDHLLSVAGGLESMMLGERQILSQVKSSYDLILSKEYSFPVFNRLFQSAIRAGKAIHTHTNLCRGAVSVSQAAVELSRKIFRSFQNRNILLVGAGETSKLVAEHFMEIGCNEFIIANRGEKRRKQLAERFNGRARAIPLDQIPDALLKADIVVTAVKAPDYLITYKDMTRAMKGRKYRVLLLIDISTPRVIDPRIAKISEAFSYNIDHLKNVIADNLGKRKEEIPAARSIVFNIREEFFSWLRTLEVVPTISKLTGYFDAIRMQELKKYAHKTTEKEYSHMEQLSKSIIRKLLHYPITSLRGMSNRHKLDLSKIEVIWELFRLYDFKGKDK